MKKKSVKKLFALMLAASMVLGLTACGGKGGSTGSASGETDIDTEGKDTNFSMLAVTAVTLDQYKDYNEFPAIEYWLDKEWDANGDGKSTKINVDIWAPTAGAESDYVNTLISTGDYPDVLNLVYASQSAGQMFEDGWTLDLTDYVNAYMPNYKAFLEKTGLRGTTNINGEQRYIQILQGNHDIAEPWGGLMYRRDWIVNFGTNPQTGEAFSGEWITGEDGQKEWTDNVVFPSGEKNPVTISDWEWMFGIFKPYLDGLAANGLNGYCCQLSYEGEFSTGDLMSGFGGIGASYYFDQDGNIAFGGDSEGQRAYIECMTNWYKNGWIDTGFAERASDMFFLIDAPTIYTGICGAWYGLNSQLLDGLAGDGSNPLTANAVVFAAASPINDKYGDPSAQNKVPVSYYNGGYGGGSWVITDAAKDKDIASLLTAIDWWFKYDEGSVVFTRGLSSDIMANAKGDESWYKKYQELGLPNGACTIREDGTIVVDPSLVYDHENREEAAVAQRLCGAARNITDKGFSKTMLAQFDEWTKYAPTGYIYEDLTNQLKPDDATAYNTFGSNYHTTMAQWIPQYIMGTYDATNDADWAKYVAEVQALNPDASKAALQAIVDETK